MTEIWFDDQEDFEKGMAYITESGAAKIIVEDEDCLLERASIRYHIVEDYGTNLSR